MTTHVPYSWHKKTLHTSVVTLTFWLLEHFITGGSVSLSGGRGILRRPILLDLRVNEGARPQSPFPIASHSEYLFPTKFGIKVYDMYRCDVLCSEYSFFVFFRGIVVCEKGGRAGEGGVLVCWCVLSCCRILSKAVSRSDVYLFVLGHPVRLLCCQGNFIFFLSVDPGRVQI